MKAPFGRTPCVLAMLLASLLAAGCIDYEETMRVNEDGSGEIRATIKLATAIATNPSRAGSAAAFFESDEKARELLARYDLRLDIPCRRSVEGLYTVVKFTVRFDDISRLTARQPFIVDNTVAGAFRYRLQRTSTWSTSRDGGRVMGSLIRLNREGARGNVSLPGIDPETSRAVFRIRAPGRVVDSTGYQVADEEYVYTVSANRLTAKDTVIKMDVTVGRRSPTERGRVFSVILFVITGLVVWSAISSGMWGSAISLFGVVIAIVVSLTFFEPVADLLVQTFGNQLEPYAAALGLMLLFLAALLVFMLTVVHRTTEWLNVPRWLDVSTSSLLGLIAGMLLASLIHVFYLTLPFDGDVMKGGIEVGKDPVVVSFYRHVAGKARGRNRFDPVGQFPQNYNQ